MAKFGQTFRVSEVRGGLHLENATPLSYQWLWDGWTWTVGRREREKHHKLALVICAPSSTSYHNDQVPQRSFPLRKSSAEISIFPYISILPRVCGSHGSPRGAWEQKGSLLPSTVGRGLLLHTNLCARGKYDTCTGVTLCFQSQVLVHMHRHVWPRGYWPVITGFQERL